MSRMSKNKKTATLRKRTGVLRRFLTGRRIAIMLLLALLTGGAGGVYYGWQQGHIRNALQKGEMAFYDKTVELGFYVDDVWVYGREQTDAATLRDVLQLDRGQPILAYDLQAARDRGMTLPWVQSIRITRHLPRRIEVQITERHPLAIWQRGGVNHLIDREGKVLSKDPQEIRNFQHLPIVTGPDAEVEAAQILSLVAAEDSLRGRVRGLTRNGGRRWDLHFDNGVVAKLPEVEPAAGLARLALLQRRDQVLDREMGVIDLRLADRVIVTLPFAHQDESANREEG